MGIWVRSQDREVLNEVQNIRTLNVGGTRLGTFNTSGSITELGEYESREEALAVLDGIQKGLIEKDWRTRQHVYCMPPQGFLKRRAAAKASDCEC